MTPNYSRPPLAEENRAQVEARLREVEREGGVKETLMVEWRGAPTPFPVIVMPVASLYYNPGTHRIRAQRAHDPARDKILDEAPYGADGQAYLHHLLMALPANPENTDPEFTALMASLKEYGQNDAGLITRDGVLVNANTRCAALRELSKSDMRVAVLPESCTLEDISRVELSLQLRKDHRREYSYVNRLLTIEEQVELGRPLTELARDFRTTVKACEQDLWVLQTLKDLVARSEEGGARLQLLDFEEHQEKLKELHRAYAKAAAVSKPRADLLKENRLAAIVLGFSKTDVRLIEPEFRDRYLEKHLPSSVRPKAASAPAGVAIPGLNRTVKGNDPKVEEARKLTDAVLQTKAVRETRAGATAEQKVQAAERFEAVKSAMEDALEPAGKDARVRKRKQAAPDRLSDACKDIDQCVTDLVLARGSGGLDEEAFDEAVLKLRDMLGKLALEADRSIKMPGDGLSWLLGATGKEDA
ncbi:MULTISPECIES: transcriptional regulator [unclassified Streptomyces]|uniref:transcriptional regulator n=1 Tax=unclassified Streptomyces TaxID=2593676 RepID=UPI002E19FD2C